jgi:hypothetical protein
MSAESYKAENSDEIIWLRLNRLKSTKLCENLIRAKLERDANPNFNEDIIKAKAVGVSSAVESAIGYWQSQSTSCNARILSRYYFMLQMTIAEQVSSTKNIDSLKDIQRHTEHGHGLGIITDPNKDFPDNMYVFALKSGHFYSYAKSLGLNIKEHTLDKKPKRFEELKPDIDKAVTLTDLFRRIPELNKVIEEYIDQPSLAFHIGHSFTNGERDVEAVKRHIEKTGQFVLSAPDNSPEKTTDISFYSDSKKVTTDYLAGLNTPFKNFKEYKESPFNKSSIIGEFTHPNVGYWHEHLSVYSSSYATSSYVIPLWSSKYDSIVTNFTLLYALSIIVRYLPDLWYRINSGDINHMGSLIEYYVSIIDHILPLQMLERINGTQISIHSPGSLFGDV